MTDENIVIGVKGEVEGGKVVKRVLDEIVASEAKAQKGSKALESQFNATDNAAKFLKNTMQTLGAAFGLRQLQQTVDTYTNIQNRLKLVTNNAEELTGVTKELFRISNDTRVAFEGTAEVYARVALATKDLGLSQRDTLQFAESLNQAVVLSGASAAEAAAGLIQLSQGLASGALRGDELRSVLEQLPAVADVIAKSLGITRGELRQMGQDGKITADIIIEAFKKSREELAENFAKTVPTIGQAFTVLQNHVIQFVGELDHVTGSSAAVAKSLLWIADNIDTLAKALAIATAAWGAYQLAMYAATGATVIAAIAGNVVAFVQLAATVTTVAEASALMNAAFLIGPGAFIAALAAAGAAAYVFRDELTAAVVHPIAELIILTDKAAAGLGKLFGKEWSVSGLKPEELRQAADDMITQIATKDDPTQNQGRVSTTGGPRTVTPSSDVLDAAKDAQKQLKQLIKETSTEQETLLRKISDLDKLKPYAKTKDELEAINRAQQIYNEQLKTASDTIPTMDSAMDRLVKQTDKFAESAASAFKDFVTGAKSGKEALSDLVGSLYQMVIQETITSPLSDLLRGVLKGGGGSSGGGLLSGFGSSLQSAAGSLFGSIGSGIKSFFGFDSGGSMVLGGNGGVDQNILSLNGAPIARTGRGEVLSISPTQAGGGGGGVTVNQVFNLSMGVGAAVAAELAAVLPQIQQSTINAVKEAQLRGIS